MIKAKTSIVAGLLSLLLAPLAANGSALFDGDDALTLTIEAPFGTLFKDLLNEGTYVEATLSGEGLEPHAIKIRPRGKTRRNPDICNFPPLTVNLKTSEMEGTVFEGQDKLKLVTHCQDKKQSYQVYYRQEYHIYKVYNLLTEESFRVRPANITYVDTDGRRKTVTAFGFFIEDADELATRIGLERHKVEKFPSDDLVSFKASRIDIFQYLIGNLDWSTIGGPAGENCCHNSKPFVDAQGKVTPVPYDFDFSGAVNAKYASPPQGITLRNIRERLFRGRCKHNAGVPAAINLIRQNREAITALYERSPFLSEKEASGTLKYYDGFFKTVDDPKALDRKIIRKCR